jgi:hypothetical protein
VKVRKTRAGPTTIDSEFKKTEKKEVGFSSTLQAIDDEGEKGTHVYTYACIHVYAYIHICVFHICVYSYLYIVRRPYMM